MHRRVPSGRLSSLDGGNVKGASSNGHIRVVVRVRPPNDAESAANGKTVIRVLDEHVLIFDPLEDVSGEFYQGRRRRGRDLNKRKNRDVRFAFDQVFDVDTQNVEVYERTTKLILDGLLDGYNCAVFAYGATGAGKTYTMLGNYNTPGVMFLTVMDLYHRIENIKAEKTCDIAVSYLEVYNEQIADLLVPKGFLPIREDPQAGVVVPGLSLHKPKTAEELLQMLNFGNKNRTQHPTDANAESSRSHAVFQVFVRQHDRTANISTDVRIAKMSLIDLAGSERGSVTTNKGARFREGANINKSLLALGNCINALAEGKSKGYIPYRNSKLTRLLKDSLGGNCHTIMIAAVSPSSSSFEDTYNTLCYANRAKNIKAQLKRNVLSVDFHISKYAKIVDELRKEVCELKSKVKTYEDAANLPPPVPVSSVDVDRLHREMRVIFEERRHIRQELLELEGKERDLAVRLNIKEKCLLRVKAICLQCDEKAVGKISHMIDTIRMKQNRVLSRKQRLTERLADNTDSLQQIETEVTNIRNNGADFQLLECRLKMFHQEVELLDTKRHVRCLQNVCRYQQNYVTSTEKIVLKLLQAYRQVYFILKGHHLATNDLTSQYDVIQHLVEGEREVIWADQCDEDGQSSPDPDKIFLNHILQFPVLHNCYEAGDGAHLGATPFKTPGHASCCPVTPACVTTPGRTPGFVPRPATPLMASGPNTKPVGAVHSTASECLDPPQRCSSVRLNLNTMASYQQSTPVAAQRIQPECVQLSLQPVQPAPTPQHVPLTPLREQSTLQHTQLALQHSQPTPQPIQPALDHPQYVQLSTEIACPTPSIIQPVSQYIHPIAQNGSPTQQQKFTQHPVIGQLSPVLLSQKQNSDTSMIEGVTPLMPTPEYPRTVSITHQTHTPCRPIPIVASGTVTIQKQVTSTLRSDINSVECSLSTASQVVSNGAVSNVFGPMRTITKSAFSNINCSTVTKPMKNTEERENEEFTSVVENASPKGRCLTFADVVKSPGINLKRHLSDSPVFRSPLASCENIIETNKDNYPKRGIFYDKLSGKQKQITRSSSSLQSVSRADNMVQRSLHRMGLPSVMDMKNNKKNIPRRDLEHPKYGHPSGSSSAGNIRRQRSTSVGALSNDFLKPKRQKTDESKRPSIKRSQSQHRTGPQQLRHRPAFI